MVRVVYPSLVQRTQAESVRRNDMVYSYALFINNFTAEWIFPKNYNGEPHTFFLITMSNRSELFRNWIPIGCGSYGRVYKAEYILDGQIYAIKRISSHDRESMLMALKEVRRLSSTNHPHIVRYYGAWIDVYKQNDTIGTLLQVDKSTTCGTLQSQTADRVDVCIQMMAYDSDLRTRMSYSYTDNDCMNWIVQLLSAIYELRRLSIIHHDICPTNILMDNRRQHVVVSDFGDVSKPTQSVYRAPVMYECMGVDIYALFVISIELFYRFGTLSETFNTLRDPIRFLQSNDKKTDYLDFMMHVEQTYQSRSELCDDNVIDAFSLIKIVV